MSGPEDFVPGAFRRPDGTVDREKLAERVRSEIEWVSNDWASLREAVKAFEDRLRGIDSRKGYVRNWTVAHPGYEPAIDLRVARLSATEAGDELLAEANMYAAGLATSETQASERLPAGTRLELTTGTNAGCCDGWATSIFTVADGHRAGARLAFFDELRWGLGPALATAALRRVSAARKPGATSRTNGARKRTP
jgi:hypothetical protein